MAFLGQLQVQVGGGGKGGGRRWATECLTVCFSIPSLYLSCVALHKQFSTLPVLLLLAAPWTHCSLANLVCWGWRQPL